MDHDFWHQKWEDNQIGFHLAEANPLLVQHFPNLALKQAARIFLPLCGKTLDIGWLLNRGYQVVGAELSTIAVESLFKQLNLKPKVSALGNITRYETAPLTIFAGDIFALKPAQLGPIDAIYDRAAFVALPDDMRLAYSQHLVTLCAQAPQLLITLHYDEALHQGPPFSISKQTVQQHYQQAYKIDLLASETMANGLKGKHPATEQAWLLTPDASA